MKSTTKLFFLVLILLVTACTNNSGSTDAETPDPRNNPLLMEWDTPFGVPPFDKIKSEDYLPAFEIALERHNEEIDNICKNEEVPTFKNTVEALEVSGVRPIQDPFGI